MLTEKVFDCHVHVDKGLDRYNLDVSGKNIIFNDVDSYKSLAAAYNNDTINTISLIFDYKNNFDFICHEVRQGKVKALKIHSRVQNLTTNDYSHLIHYLQKTDESIPVIIDAFYFGTPLEFQPDLSKIVQLASTFPKRKFIVAHCGGYEVLKYFFHLRDFKNVLYDLSFSLQYLADSSVFIDLKKLIKYTDKKHIMFGSDYSYADPKMQLQILSNLLDEINVTSEERQHIFYDNALETFK